MKSLVKYLTSAFVGAGLLFNVATAKAESLSGKVYDALTSDTMKSFPVQLDREKTFTDSNGNYSFDAPQGNHHLKISDNITHYFNYEEDINLTTTLQKNVYMIPIKPVDTNYYSDFLTKLKALTNKNYPVLNQGYNILHLWRNEFRPIKIWYNEPQAIQLHGQDIAQRYFDACDKAIQEWNQKSGVDLLQWVNANPDVGIEVSYIGNSHADYLAFFPDNTRQKVRLYIGDGEYLRGAEQLRKVYEHELGHAIALDHSADPNDNMNRQPFSEISQNESDIVKIIFTMPNFTDMDHYNSTRYENAVKDWRLY